MSRESFVTDKIAASEFFISIDRLDSLSDDNFGSSKSNASDIPACRDRSQDITPSPIVSASSHRLGDERIELGGGVTFEHAQISGAVSIKRANKFFYGECLGSSYFEKFKQSETDDVDFTNDEVEKTSFNVAHMEKLEFRNNTFSDVIIIAKHIENVRFTNEALKSVTFNYKQATNLTYQNVKFEGVRFEGKCPVAVGSSFGVIDADKDCDFAGVRLKRGKKQFHSGDSLGKRRQMIAKLNAYVQKRRKTSFFERLFSVDLTKRYEKMADANKLICQIISAGGFNDIEKQLNKSFIAESKRDQHYFSFMRSEYVKCLDECASILKSDKTAASKARSKRADQAFNLRWC